MAASDSRGRRPSVTPVTALLSIAVVGGLFLLVDWRSVAVELGELNLRWAAAGLVATILTLWCRSRRLRLLLPTAGALRPAPESYFSLVVAHQIVFALLPSGTGDAVFPFLARRYLDQSPYVAAAALAAARLHDLMTLAGIGAIAAAWYWVGGMPGLMLTLAVCGGVLLTLFRTSALISMAARLFHRAFAETSGLRALIDARTAELAAWFREHHGAWNRPGPAGWTILSWTSATFAVGAALAATGMPVSVERAALTLFVLNVAGAMAVLTFAGLGFVEFGLVSVLVLFGVERHQALATAVTVRLLLLSFNVAVPGLLLALAAGGRVIVAQTTRKF